MLHRCACSMRLAANQSLMTVADWIEAPRLSYTRVLAVESNVTVEYAAVSEDFLVASS